MGLDQLQLRRAVEAVKNGVAPPDGPVLAVFEPTALAKAIDHECDRIAHLPNQRITVTMDSADARALACFLRGGS